MSFRMQTAIWDGLRPSSQKNITQFIDDPQNTSEVVQLLQQVELLQKNYIAIENHYQEQVLTLQRRLADKDLQQKRLKKQVCELKVVAADQVNKVRKLLTKNKKSSPQSRIKSKSPITLKKVTKEAQVKCDQGQSHRNNRKSPSPNPDEKNSQKMQSTRKAFYRKSPLGSNNILNIGTNSSGDIKKMRVGKKQNRPKQQVSQFQAQTLKHNQRKSNTKNGLDSLRQRVPVFK